MTSYAPYKAAQFPKQWSTLTNLESMWVAQRVRWRWMACGQARDTGDLWQWGAWASSASSAALIALLRKACNDITTFTKQAHLSQVVAVNAAQCR